MRHSVIIPHRNRHRNLTQCLWTINRSARHCGITDYEVIVVDNGSDAPPTETAANTTILADPLPMRVFNKPSLLNLGIAASTGEVLTFLDADAIVGLRWLQGASLLRDRSLTRLCYRVRYLPQTAACDLEEAIDRDILVDQWFRDYDALGMGRHSAKDRYRRAFEAYGKPEAGYAPETDRPIFGNSQFSITRQTLANLRFDEGYVAAGFEDIAFNREIWRRYGDKYRGEIVTDGDEAMFHVDSPRDTKDGKWGHIKFAEAGERRYKNT